MRKLPLIILTLLLAAARPAAGQSPTQQSLLTSRLDMQGGLSDNCVNDIVMDSRKLLWVGTNAGLDLYDGSNIVRVAFEDAVNDIQPVVFTLAEDPAGIIWAGTSNGLYLVDPDRLRMKRFTAVDDDPIRLMRCSASGQLWIAYKGQGIVRVNTADNSVSTLPLIAASICCDGRGGIWAVAPDGGLWHSGDGSSEPECVSADAFADIHDISDCRIESAGAYLFVVHRGGNSYYFRLEDGSKGILPVTSRVREALQHSSGDIWLAARDGIHVLDSNLAIKQVLRPFRDNSFRCLEPGTGGGVWAGTLFEGLAWISPDKLGYSRYSGNLAGSRFKARDFAETPDGLIWIGSDTRGLLCLDPAQPGKPARKPLLQGHNVSGLMAEGDKLWVGTIGDNLPVMLLDTRTGRTTAYPGAGTSAYAFCRDASGRLWVGGKDGFTIGRDRDGGRFDQEASIPCAQVCRIVCTQGGDVWVASIAGQVFRYTQSRFTTYKIPISNILTDIAVDGKGRVFATSEGGGLWRYEPGTDKFESVSVAEPRLLKIARQADGDLLWITGAHGIHILNPDDTRKLPVITLESLGIDSFNYSSNFISSDGTLYAGTSDGFISFSAAELAGTPAELEAPVITSLHVASSSGKENGVSFLYPRHINIGPNTRSFTANVSSLDYGRFPDRQIYWKIAGRSDWKPVQGSSFAVFDLPSGRWDVRLKSITISGAESPETVLYLKVQPPMLESPLAFLVYFVLLLALISAIAVYSDRRAKEKAEREHERKLLESKMEFLTSIAHEIRTPLSLVQIPLEALIRKFSSSQDSSVQENLDIMRRNSLKLTVLINELLDFRKLSDATFQIHPEYLDIRGILRDAHRRFLPTFMQEGKTLSLSLPDAPVYCETDVRCLGRILDNLLSNALKYSAHHAAVSLSVSGHEARMSVENDGAVLPINVRELVFKPFYRYEDSSGAEGTGLGLSTSLQFATLLGGSLEMDDDLSVNRFIFTIPVSAHNEVAATLPVVESKERTVMVVEDDRDMANVIGDILEDQYNIIYASNGRQAIEKIEAGASPTVVISDVIMPEMDGIALTKALKGNLATSHIPVILLSAEIPDTFMQESIDEGADAYLEKPFSTKKLRSTVSNLIDNRKRVYEWFVSSLPTGDEMPTGRVSAVEQKFLRSIQEFVSANLHRTITLDDLAEVVCLSPSSLYKKMKEYADISPMEYVMKMRLGKAVELLRDDTLSVQDVAAAVGFNTHSFFSECFKREFGMTPRQWRARNVAKTVNN